MNPGFVQREDVKTSLFPAGLRVLVVDDDPICLLILDKMLRRCLYTVTTCKRAIEALTILREKKDGYDLVISDVHMPDMDGFKLLELIGLELDLPVVMMSANGETTAVMKGIKHGACDYLLKPVRIEELKNIWQHVVRKKKLDPDIAGDLEDTEQPHEYLQSTTDAADGTLKHSKKRKDVTEEEEEAELDSEDPSTSKKPRVVWSVDLHQQFVSAVNKLGFDKAVPKRILELMNAKGLTRENVASHLQKYRLYLRRISGVSSEVPHQTGGLASRFAGGPDLATQSGLDLSALAIGRMSQQVLASTLEAGLLGSLVPSYNSRMAGVDPILSQLAAFYDINRDALLRALYAINASGSLHPPMPHGPDLKHPNQWTQQMASFRQPVDKGSSGLCSLQQLSLAASLGEGGQLVALDNSLSDNSCSPFLGMQMQQRQLLTGASIATETAFSGLHGGQQMLQDGFGGKLLDGSVSNPTASDGFGPLRNTFPINNESPNLSHAGIVDGSFPSTANCLSTSHRMNTEILATNGQESVSTGEALPQVVQGPASSGIRASRLNSELNNGQCWQRLGLSKEILQTANPLWHAHYNRVSSSLQPFKAGCALVQQSGKASAFQDSTIVDVADFRPLVIDAPLYSEQSTGERESNFNKYSFDSKAENTLIPDPFLSSDNLLNSYFKQQQELMGVNKGDLAAEGYTYGTRT